MRLHRRYFLRFAAGAVALPPFVARDRNLSVAARTCRRPHCGWNRPRLKGGWGLSMHNAEHWRKRAAEMRTIADGLTALPGAKAAIEPNADKYDQLARRAEHRQEV